MKVVNTNINRFKRNIWPVYHFFLKKYRFIEGKLENKDNIDFAEFATVKDLKLCPKSSYDYEGITSRKLNKIMSLFNITENDSILDFGCGKGKALYLLSKYQFKQVDGVEISNELYDIAINNMNVLGVNKTNIFLGDAAYFKKLNDYNYFYFYNPFPGIILKVVIKNIEESILNYPRKIIIIYAEPKHQNEFKTSKILQKIKHHKKFVIYSN